MKFQSWVLALASSAICLMAAAQGSQPVAADFIVALVNSEPITNAELGLAIQRTTEQYKSQGRVVPATNTLRQEVLEGLINDRAQLQVAAQTGIRVDEDTLNQAEQTVARQNQVELPELRKGLARSGVSYAAFRAQLQEQILLQRLRERDVDSRVRLSDQEVDRYLQELRSTESDPYAQDINLAQLLIAVPEKATAEQAAMLYRQAQDLLGRLRAGESFEALVSQFSAADRITGGLMGLRRAYRYPVSFVQATQNVPVGGYSEIVRSGAGLHILKVVARNAPATLVRTVVQTRARHILLRTSTALTQDAAIARLQDYRQRIVAGRSSFESVAQQYSQDGAAAQGGDLGWSNPGMFVPEFEEVMNRLPEGEVSTPVVSRFGVHLIQVQDRRRVELNPTELREQARAQLRQIRVEEAYQTWARDIRERAFVEIRDPAGTP
jgi:peptidyl-prolyl cis-trans isomerase SurA